MQFLEKSLLGVRSAVTHLVCPHATLNFTLFPMLHIGEHQYYQSVTEQLEKHQYILTEGIDHLLAKRLTTFYQKIASTPSVGLVCQNVMSKTLLKEKTKILHIDMPKDVFAMCFGRLPLRVRIAAFFSTELSMIYLPLILNREKLADYLGSIEDVQPKYLFSDEEWNGDLDDIADDSLSRWDGILDHLLLEQRDWWIIGRLRDFHAEHHKENASAAIIYGAAHMRRIFHFLVEDLGYRVKEAKWITVFEL